MTKTLNRFLLFPLLAVPLLFGSALAQVSSVPAAVGTVIVQPGDTAYSLSKRAGLSVERLLLLNNLASPVLKVGQQLVLEDNPLHTVQPGETLYALSRKYGVTVEALKAANDLPVDAVIAVGQMLHVPNSAVASPASATASAPVVPLDVVPAMQAPVNEVPVQGPLAGSNWRDNALSLMGTPYVWGGNRRTGTDCSGFVLQVFGPLGVKLPRVSAEQARAGVPVDQNNLQPGDLLFFDTVGNGRITHVGIYMGNDTFINANSYRGQVAIDHLRGDKYWGPRYISARRVLPGNVMATQ
ncbi:C40 family peptidase [Deinococcus sp.]|uniref:C40 family peptidase n=1 Tax=Deinococcus sp. TaxID=47478 RepID=UPI0025C519E6|nr:C40 family peptidase [Deinococcus sp.]